MATKWVPIGQNEVGKSFLFLFWFDLNNFTFRLRQEREELRKMQRNEELRQRQRRLMKRSLHAKNVTRKTTK